MEESAEVSTEPLSRQTPSSLRSLIINPNSSDSIISSVFGFLTSFLQPGGDPAVLRHVLKLLADLGVRHQDLTPRIFDSVLSNLLSLHAAGSNRLAAESLAVLASISERNPSLVQALSEIGDEVFASICFGQSVSARLWLLRNAERLHLRSSLLFTLFLGLTKDPYPSIRKVALDGLVNLCKSGGFDHFHAAEGCYTSAVELLDDSEDDVRSSAVCAVSEWGKLLIASKEEMSRRKFTDAVFIRLCPMVRDMSVEVRIEAFKALGKMPIVSEMVLLQTLSKKILGGSKEKKSQTNYSGESSEVIVGRAAGAFVHGLEDEFYEVRKAAVDSLHSLSVLSTKFAAEAVNRLMGVLHDDDMVVRFKALETMHHIASCGDLRMQEKYMPAFLDAVVDGFENIRFVARKVLKLVKLPDLKQFKQCVDGILKSLEMYPQDEPDIFSALFHIGQNHANFSVSMVKRVSQEMEAASGKKSEFNSTRVAACLVLGISAPLSSKQNITSISPRIFSYSLAMLGRFSNGLADMLDQDMLLAYLSQCNLLSGSPGLEFNKGEIFPHAYKYGNEESNAMEIINLAREPSLRVDSQAEMELENVDEVIKSMNLILLKIKGAWPLSQSGFTREALQVLRSCKREIATFTSESVDSTSVSVLNFTHEYIGVMKLLVRVWAHFERARRLHSRSSAELELLMGKLEEKLMEIKCRFVGMSVEEESHVLDLVLLSCLLRLSRLEICCHLSAKKKLSSTISLLQALHEQGFTRPSDFFIETKRLLQEIGSSTDGTYHCLVDVDRLINCFSLEQLTISGNLRQISAELKVPGSSHYNPIPFVSGLPVAIPCEITLQNLSSESRLWMRIKRSDGTEQFVFVDQNILKGERKLNKFTYLTPVYNPPKAVCFTVRVSIGMECLSEDVRSEKRHHGPKHPLAYLCRETEVHLSLVSRS